MSCAFAFAFAFAFACGCGDGCDCGVISYTFTSQLALVLSATFYLPFTGTPGFEFYTASKFAVEGLMDSFRYTAAGFGISVTNVNPGPVKTEFLSRVERATAVKPSRDVVDPTYYLQYITSRMVELLGQRTNAKGVYVLVFCVSIHPHQHHYHCCLYQLFHCLYCLFPLLQRHSPALK